MSETMLMTQALDERDLLVKKINDKIDKLKLVDVKRKNEEKTADSRVTPEEFTKVAQAGYQQVIDLMSRYQRLDSAIIASNAAHYVETSQGKISVADAIALRARLKANGLYIEEGTFEETLMEQFKSQYDAAVKAADLKNKMVETQAESMRTAILGRDSKAKDMQPLEVVNAYIQENTTEIIDPLGVMKKYQELKEQTDALLSELDTRIKVSNATTTVEF